MGIIVSCGVDDIMDVIGMQGSKTGVAKKSLHLITNNPSTIRLHKMFNCLGKLVYSIIHNS